MDISSAGRDYCRDIEKPLKLSYSLIQSRKKDAYRLFHQSDVSCNRRRWSNGRRYTRNVKSMEVQQAKGKNRLHIKLKPSFFILAGFFFFVGPYSLFTGSMSQKWQVLTIVGYIGLVAMSYHFSNKWDDATPQQRVKLVLALSMGFFLLETMILIQGKA